MTRTGYPAGLGDQSKSKQHLMKKYHLVFLLIALFYVPAQACTIAIISGEHTPDGRPIIWKHRDTGTLDNKVVIYDEGSYRAAGLINSNDDGPERVWIGHNEAGFAIMNSASYNLWEAWEEDSITIPHQTGYIMRDALTECATVEDFEQFLLNRPQPWGVETNFAVMDAQGNAAYFETDNYAYTRIDVDDKAVAPHGYIVRSNYSFTGKPNEGAGYIRFQTAEQLFYRASGTNNLSMPYLIENMALSVHNSYSGQDARNALHLRETESKFMYFQDCINRYSSSSSVFIQGVRSDEDPGLTTMWAMVGFPLSSVAVPVWITPDESLPSIITAPGTDHAPICDWALELKYSRMVPSTRGSTQYYIDAVQVNNADDTGVTQQLLEVNREVYEVTRQLMEQWYPNAPEQGAVNDHYQWMDEFISRAYEEKFGISVNK